MFVYADTPTPTPSTSSSQTASSSATSEQQKQLRDKISELQSKVSQLQSEGKTLTSQIEAMDSQIKLTETRMEATREEINELTLDIDSATKRMHKLEGSLDEVSKTLINRIVATYQLGGTQPLEVLLSSNDVSDLTTRANYLRLVQDHDKQLLYDMQQARNDYGNQKLIFEDKKKKIEALKTQLEDYTKQLDSDKQSKEKLLTETKGSEANYQRLLSAAKAQLAAFGRFTQLNGGASLLSNQTVCDDWGCYYNQRDSQWGGNSLNGTQYSLASDGCLVTSMAMMYTHFGHRSVTPQTINSIPSNFASYYPAYLKFEIVADGASSSRVSTAIDNELSAGRPVIVGISYDSGPIADHFLVIVSGSNGDYTMKDPYTPNGNNISFSSKYAVSSIRNVYKVVM